MARIVAVATAVPPHRLDQGEARRLACAAFADAPAQFARMAGTFANAGILQRRLAAPPGWFAAPHGWDDRHRAFLPAALALLEDAARRCLAAAGVEPEDLDGVVTVCTTGVATPSLDAHLMGRLGLRPDIVRLPLFGLGCAGGVLGLNRSAVLADALPGGRVLLLVVELCSLTFRRSDGSKANMVASALFGDGAAAVLVDRRSGPRAVTATGEHTWPDSTDVMGWTIEADGFGVRFSRDIPTWVRERLPQAADAFLARHGLARGDVDRFVCHPGGAKVVAALECAFALPPAALEPERAVLREYGNMSAATIWHVFERHLARGLGRRNLLLALGPGFTAAFALVEG